MKKIVFLLLAFVTLFSFSYVSFAASEEAINDADILHELGLFNGVGSNSDGTPNYDLDREPTRAEAVTMLVRLLGKEEEANATEWDIPFNDVASWAKPYVGYAYTNGLTSGTSATTFSGNSTVSATQYITFALRALGYSSDSDFEWDEAWKLSDKIGITNGQYGNGTEFTRGDTVIVSKNSLYAKVNGTDKTLLESLDIQTPEKTEDDNTLVAPPILDANINQYLLSLKPDECREAGDEDGKLWHMYWYGRDVTPEINKYLKGLDDFKIVESYKHEFSNMEGNLTRVEILDNPDLVGKGYSVQWIGESEMMVDNYWLKYDNESPEPKPDIEDVNTGDYSINEALFKYYPDRCEENSIPELKDKFYALYWDDGDESLYRDLCLIFKDYPNYSDTGEEVFDTIFRTKFVRVEIVLHGKDKDGEIYSYHVEYFSGKEKMQATVFYNREFE